MLPSFAASQFSEQMRMKKLGSLFLDGINDNLSFVRTMTWPNSKVVL